MPGETVLDVARTQLDELAGRVDLPAGVVSAARRGLRSLPPVVTGAPLAEPPRWSAVGDDCSPLEWSVVLRDGAPDLRLLVEPQADPASPRSYWDAALRFEEQVVPVVRGSTARVRLIDDLFAPGEDDVYFVRWYGLEWPGSGSPRVKVYLNPSASGRPAAEVVVDALERLGFVPAAGALLEGLGRGGARVSHLSLDLVDGAARVKVYLRVAETEEARWWYERADGASGEDVAAVVGTLCGPEGLRRPGFVVLHHLDPAAAGPARTVWNVALLGHAPDDATAGARVAVLARRLDIDAAAVAGIAAAAHVAAPPGTPAEGGISFVSLQREDGRPRLTVYLGLRAFAGRWGWAAALDPAVPWPSPHPR